MNLFETGKLKHIAKGEILLYPGKFSTCAYQVVKGCLRSYVIDKAAKEHIVQFAPEGWSISDMDSFFNQKPASLYIDAIEDSEVFLFDRSRLPDLEKMVAEDLLTQSNKLVNNVIAVNKRLILLLSSTAEERYLSFIETYPTLAQRLPLKLIASYIGITPEYLSEIRKKLAKRSF